LFVDDVIQAFDLATQNIDKVKGEAINLGGGKENVASLLETIAYLESLTNKKMRLSFKGWRPGDNKCYYTNYQKAKKLLGWLQECLGRKASGEPWTGSRATCARFPRLFETESNCIVYSFDVLSVHARVDRRRDPIGMKLNPIEIEYFAVLFDGTCLRVWIQE
jgi:hypothetical protein